MRIKGGPTGPSWCLLRGPAGPAVHPRVRCGLARVLTRETSPARYRDRRMYAHILAHGAGAAAGVRTPRMACDDTPECVLPWGGYPKMKKRIRAEGVNALSQRLHRPSGHAFRLRALGLGFSKCGCWRRFDGVSEPSKSPTLQTT